MKTTCVKSCNGSNWVLINHHIPLVQIEAGDDEVWAVNASNQSSDAQSMVLETGSLFQRD